MLVSIIIPLYNREQLVRETLDSVLAQTYTHWECIIVDDRSTDNSLATAKEYAARDNRFKVFHRDREPKGAPTCRNIGLEKAEGAYVMFLDSDDLLADFCLERRVEYINHHNELDFAVFQTGLLFQGEITDKKFTQLEPNYLRAFLEHKIPWNIKAPLWQTEFIRKFGGFHEGYPRLQDAELHSRVLMSNCSYEVLTQEVPDAFYRVNFGHKAPLSGLKGFFLFIRDMACLTNNRDDYNVLKSDLKKTYLGSVNYFVNSYNRRKALPALRYMVKTTKICRKFKIVSSSEYRIFILFGVSFMISGFWDLKKAKEAYLKKLEMLSYCD